jgi:hypothetical protein
MEIYSDLVVFGITFALNRRTRLYRKHQNGQLKMAEILLIPEVLVGGDQDAEVLDGASQELSVRQRRPSKLKGGSTLRGR